MNIIKKLIQARTTKRERERVFIFIENEKIYIFLFSYLTLFYESINNLWLCSKTKIYVSIYRN